MTGIYISGFGCHHPDERVTNAQLESGLETSDAWIVDRTGIEERRRIAPGEQTYHLAERATRHALDRSGWKSAELDLLICATSSPDSMLPSVASHTANALMADPASFDVNGACAGLAFGIATAGSMMRTMGYRRTAVCSVDTYTRYIDYGDRRSAVLFGDGAATLLLQPERPTRGAEIVDVHLEHRHDGLELVHVPMGGTWQLEGRKVTARAFELMLRCSETLLERNHLGVEDLRGFIAHQANLRILESVADSLGVAPEQHWHNVRHYGNQGAAGAATVLCQRVDEMGDDLREGDLILVTVVGAGITAGSVLLRWTA